MDMHTNPLNAVVVMAFGQPMMAIWLSGVMLLGCLAILTWNKFRYHDRFIAALKTRLAALDPVAGAEDTETAQALFKANFDAINEAMSSGGKASQELRQSWMQFRETILDESEDTIRATTRADGYFLHLGDDTRILAWWANIFVAVGLTFTFLGIVAALTFTVQILSPAGGSGGSAPDMTKALVGLLSLTSVKFWTSIAGVFSSILLRLFDRRWHAASLAKLERLVEALDYGTLFSPAQRIADAHLRETREQTAALKSFSHELAVAIGDSFGKQMAPMVSALGGIQSSIDDFKSGSFNQIGKELGEALSRQAGNEMQQLGDALTHMTTQLGSIHQQLEGSGRSANEQIAAAARDFSEASTRMHELFAGLHERVDDLGKRLSEATASAADTTGGAFAQAANGLTQSFEQMHSNMAHHFAMMTRSADAAADKNGQLLEKAATTLNEAAGRASEGLNAAIDEAVAKATEQSARAISDAFAAFGERFESATAGMVDTLRGMAVRMESLAQSIERSSHATDTHASRLIEAGEGAQRIAGALGSAANDLQQVATPIRSASELIGSAMSRAGEAIERQAAAATAHETAATAISRSLSETTESATRAWNDYRDRFEDVDDSLAEALDQIKSASNEHAAHLNEQVGKMDNALAGAVDKLSAALEPLTDLSERIDDMLGRLKVQA